MTAPTDPPEHVEKNFSTKLLVDLVLDPREPGYEEAAKRRGGRPANHWFDKPLLTVGCLLAGFLLAVAYAHTHRSAPETAKVHSALVDRVRSAETRTDELARTEQHLTDEVNTIRNSALAGSGKLQQQLRTEQLQSGQTPVSGPGLRVTLTEPSTPNPSSGNGRAPETPTSAGNILSDRDVRSVVNQLWSDGAQAVAVNGIRLTPTSAIRFAGEAVLVDLQPITSPYVIEAIGDANQLDTGFAASAVASRYQTLKSAKGIGFTFGEESTLRFPATSTPATLRYATPGGTP